MAQARGLAAVLESQCDSYRFYSASLLLVYDSRVQLAAAGHQSGPDVSVVRRLPAQLKLIDFAKSTHRHMSDAVREHSGPDPGCVLGLASLQHFLCSLLRQPAPPSLQQLQQYM